METHTRVLAVDPGEKRFGLAISDPTGTIANPLEVFEAQSREEAAQHITEVARERKAQKIVVGQALNWDGERSQQANKAARLVTSIRKRTELAVIPWNEYGSTQIAQEARIALGLSRKKRQKPVDHLAATVILQSYLDAQKLDGEEGHEE